MGDDGLRTERGGAMIIRTRYIEVDCGFDRISAELLGEKTRINREASKQRNGCRVRWWNDYDLHASICWDLMRKSGITIPLHVTAKLEDGYVFAPINVEGKTVEP